MEGALYLILIIKAKFTIIVGLSQKYVILKPHFNAEGCFPSLACNTLVLKSKVFGAAIRCS